MARSNYAGSIGSRKYEVWWAASPSDNPRRYYMDFAPTPAIRDQAIDTYYGTDNFLELLGFWNVIKDCPPSWWYWIMDFSNDPNGVLILCGACDPDDYKILANYAANNDVIL